MTIKQKEALHNVVENGGNISKGMREAGYSNNTAKNPNKLTNSKAWKDLLDYYLPDEMLLAVLAEDIKHRPESRRQLLDLAFKIKGAYKNDHSINLHTHEQSNLRRYEDIIARDKEKYGI